MQIRLFIVAALVGAAGITTAALIPWTLSESSTGAQVSAQMSALSGLSKTSHGPVRFTALPVPRIEVADVRLADDRGEISISAETLRGTVRLLPLMAGRLELGELTLVHPAMELAGGARRDALARLAQWFNASRPPQASGVRRLKIADGVLMVREEDGSSRPVLQSLDASFTRSRSSDVVDAALDFVWNGEPVDIAATGRPASILSEGETGPVSLKIVSGRVTLGLDGTASGGLTPQLAGSLTLRSPDLQAASDWLGVALPITPAGGLDLSATARFQPSAYEFANARIAIGAGQFDGALSVRPRDGVLGITGTLATDRLDLTQGLAQVLPARGDDGGWSREPFAPDAMPRGDLDLRISAARLLAGAAVVENAAFSVMAHAGRVDVVLGDSDFYRGTLRGRGSAVANGNGGYDVRLQGGLDKVDFALALPALGAGKRLTGLGSGTFALEGSGDSLATVIRSLDGKALLTLRQGEVVGVNLPELLKRIERRPLLAALDVRGGRTPFSSASFVSRVHGGVLEFSDANFISPAARVSLGGQIGLGERSLAVQGVAQAVAAAGAASEPVSLPFEVSGTFDDPLIVPDAKSLIRRSGAAAPFFGAAAKAAPVSSEAAGLAPLPQ